MLAGVPIEGLVHSRYWSCILSGAGALQCCGAWRTMPRRCSAEILWGIHVDWLLMFCSLLGNVQVL